ncbi:MAG: TonB-dependent receptor, partial [Gammaproteobacteria bacterium]|nr:TonB-dependent receptor [Gammaproteobacteria bacterium]
MQLQVVSKLSVLSFIISSILSPVAVAESTDAVTGTITVTGTREEVLKAETAETSDQLDQQIIQDTKPAHPAEILDRIPGVHISVTNGEGH